MKPTIKSVLELIEVFNPDATVEIKEGGLIVTENGIRFRVDIEKETITEDENA